MKNQEFIFVVFDRTDARHIEAFHRLRSAFGLAAAVEALAANRVALHLNPGGTLELAA